MRRQNDPLGSFRFILELGFFQVAGFSECTGLQLETKIYEYKEGGRNTSSLKFPDTGSVGNITLKRGLSIGSNAYVLFDWHNDVMNGVFTNQNKRKPDPDEDIDRKCTIILMDDSGSQVKRWTLFRAFPVKWTGPELKATTNEVAIETLEIACEGIEMIRE
ncbi:MAG: phage tail protein [Bacteroidales bacterium]|nr:phage tail protein [Bacteroidales bacterium]